MQHLHYDPYPADPDVWMRPGTGRDGLLCYKYILIYFNDALAVSANVERIIRDELVKYFKLKEASIGLPKIYLGSSFWKVELKNGAKAWSFGASQYVNTAVKNVEEFFKNYERYTFPRHCNTPFTTSYLPELDVSLELNQNEASYYMSLIGIMIWIVELGRVDIWLEISMMSSHIAIPREGHLRELFHVFSYLKKYHNTKLVLNLSEPIIDNSMFERKDWTSIEFGHIDGEEFIPSNATEPQGFSFIINAQVNVNHAGDTVTRRSSTGFLVYVNRALICWNSKKQNSVESSSFGSEFMAMKACCEYIRGLRYKLRMLGIPVNGPALISGDNQSVLANTTILDSNLKRRTRVLRITL